jgi:hypothetical protein
LLDAMLQAHPAKTREKRAKQIVVNQPETMTSSPQKRAAPPASSRYPVDLLIDAIHRINSKETGHCAASPTKLQSAVQAGGDGSSI